MSTAHDEHIVADSLLTSYQVGTLLQVNPSSVNKWIKDGRLTAFRTPGGHRRIRAADVVSFLQTHKMPVPLPLAEAAHRRVLLIDSDPQQIDAIRKSLAGLTGQIELVVVKHSLEALLEMGRHRPHVVLLSTQSGPLDCLEVCRQLRAHADTKEVSVLIIGEHPDVEFKQRAVSAGAHAVISSPFAGHQLLAALGLPVAA